MKKEPSQVVMGLVDGIEVLRELAASPAPVAGAELARTLGLSPVRVNRLLKTLAWLGIAYRDPSRRYTAGPGMHVLAAQSLAASGLLGSAIACMTPLLAYPHTVALGVLWRDRVTFLYHRRPDALPLEGVRQWVTPATTSSVGMALLADQSDEEIRALYGSRQNIPGPYATFDELMAAVAEVRAAGHAVLRHAAHLSMGVAVGRPAFAAVAVSGFKTAEEEARFADLLHEVAEAIAARGPTTPPGAAAPAAWLSV